jgi:hypothetical protein
MADPRVLARVISDRGSMGTQDHQADQKIEFVLLSITRLISQTNPCSGAQATWHPTSWPTPSSSLKRAQGGAIKGCERDGRSPTPAHPSAACAGQMRKSADHGPAAAPTRGTRLGTGGAPPATSAAAAKLIDQTYQKELETHTHLGTERHTGDGGSVIDQCCCA